VVECGLRANNAQASLAHFSRHASRRPAARARDVQEMIASDAEMLIFRRANRGKLVTSIATE